MVYAASIGAVYEATRSAIATLGWQSTLEDWENYRIEAKVPMSLWTWGDELTVVLSAEAGGCVRVDAQSKTGSQVIDYGKNRRNMLALFDAIEVALKPASP